MQGALVILAVLAAVGLLLFYSDRKRRGARGESQERREEREERGEERKEREEKVCCGLHAVCEKKYAVPAAEEPVYYDDEELDVLCDRDPSTYSEKEIEMLRDVVLTLRAEDAWGWSRSLEQRRIALPAEIRDELLMLMDNS